MPVALLLCEGEAQSFDVRLLLSILRNAVGEIRPSGGKDGFPNLVRSHRRTTDRTCGICDGDFPRKPPGWALATTAQEWSYTFENKTVRIGWRWRRKEIENYLLDPDVLQRTYGWSTAKRGEYERHLDRALDQLGEATAARTALTACAPTKNRLSTRIDGRQDAPALEKVLRTRAVEYNKGATLNETTLVTSFHDLIPMCTTGGHFRRAGLSFFAGKDIAAQLTCQPGIQKLERSLKNIDDIGDEVITALSRAPAPHTWLPEWQSLRDAVEAWAP